jgi:DnaJ domain
MPWQPICDKLHFAVQIKKSFKELSKQCHPDWASREDQASAAVRFKRLNAAYQELVQSGAMLRLPNGVKWLLWMTVAMAWHMLLLCIRVALMQTRAIRILLSEPHWLSQP